MSAFFSALAAIPKLLEIVEKLVSWFATEIAAAKKRKLEEEMAKAVEIAKDTKDTSKIDQLFDPSKK